MVDEIASAAEEDILEAACDFLPTILMIIERQSI